MMNRKMGENGNEYTPSFTAGIIEASHLLELEDTTDALETNP